MSNRSKTLARLLRGSTALCALLSTGAILVAASANAQEVPNPTSTENTTNDGAGVQTAAASAEQEPNQTVVVTGSLFRRTNAETPSPVTVISAQAMEERGLNTVAEALQRISAGNAGTITQGWNNGNNFAAGANAVSLRGLTVQATLSVFDGLRMAPYPLADDGQRNFVDINTIPNAIVERIEVVRDGASSTFGADAVAGVINIITKKEMKGLHLNGSAGISQLGDAGERRFDATWGYGDLSEDGFNIYVSGEYLKQDTLWARDRGYPFNTADWSRICNDSGGCMTNLNANGVSPDGFFNGFSEHPGHRTGSPRHHCGCGHW